MVLIIGQVLWLLCWDGLSYAAMAFGGIAIIVGIFGIPKVLWQIFAFLLLACFLVVPIIIAVNYWNPLGFYYINGECIYNDLWISLVSGLEQVALY